jgi:hypothetical protein
VVHEVTAHGDEVFAGQRTRRDIGYVTLIMKDFWTDLSSFSAGRAAAGVSPVTSHWSAEAIASAFVFARLTR